MIGDQAKGHALPYTSAHPFTWNVNWWEEPPPPTHFKVRVGFQLGGRNNILLGVSCSYKAGTDGADLCVACPGPKSHGGA